MKRTLRAIVWSAALIVALTAQTPRPAEPPQAFVSIAFESENDVPHLRVFGAPPFTLDLHALTFSLRPYAGFAPDPNAQPQPIAVQMRRPTLRALPGGYGEYLIPIVVATPPKPGMYELSADAAPGFARDAHGASLTPTRAANVGIGAIAAWWPDEGNGDPGLLDVRARFEKHPARTYGSLPLTCATWGTGTAPQTAIDIGTVRRETGRAAVLQTGATWGGGDHGFSFLAFNPLVLQIADAHIPPIPELQLSPCSFAFRFADPWHVDTAISTGSPPGDAYKDLRVGMSRDEVVWGFGYPNAYGTVASFRAQSRWDYDAPAPFSWWVRFENDVVVELHPPGNTPG